MLGMEAPGSNSGSYILFQHFCAFFYPALTTLLEYPDSAILHLFGFCFVAL